jgi:hypothetical protein
MKRNPLVLLVADCVGGLPNSTFKFEYPSYTSQKWNEYMKPEHA